MIIMSIIMIIIIIIIITIIIIKIIIIIIIITINSSGCVRFAQDLGLCPQLISERTLRRLLEKIQQGRGRGRGRGEGGGGGGDEMKNVTATAASYSTNSTSSTTFVSPSSMKPSSTSSTSALQFRKSGLGFCEFIELIATIAIESTEMKNKEIFPTDFSKVFIMYFVRFVLFIFL